MQAEPSLFECLIAEFEDAWASGCSPSIGSFLKRVDDPTCRQALLYELVCVDLEFRWRASAKVPDIVWGLEYYVKEFDELGSLEALPIAIKFLRKSFWHDRSAVERFLTEARVVSLLKHPGIIRVHGVGSTPGGGFFIVMDHFTGPDLAQVIKQGPVAVQDAVAE